MSSIRLQDRASLCSFTIADAPLRHPRLRLSSAFLLLLCPQRVPRPRSRTRPAQPT
jgi:hypothetical protein